MSRHRGRSAAALVVLLVLVAVMIAPAFMSSSAATVGDSTTCSGWSSATRAQQDAYSPLYLQEYGGLPRGAENATGLTALITSACVRAAYLGEAADVSIVAAIKHYY